MSRNAKRLSCLIVATVLLPLAAWSAYFVARYLDGDPVRIDNNGAGLGVFMLLASVCVISRVASREGWIDRVAISLALSAAFFALSWVQFGNPALSPDASPRLVWYGACVAAFAPVVVVVALADWARSTLRVRRGVTAHV